MTTLSQTSVTDLRVHWSKGDKGALNKPSPLVYEELHKLASRYLRRELLALDDALDRLRPLELRLFAGLL